MPRRPPGLDVVMALLGAGLAGALAWRTTREAWGPPPPDRGGRLRRSTLAMLGVTAPVLALFGAYGAVSALRGDPDELDVLARLLGPRFFLVLAAYVPWALLQQALFQVYLLGRWRALLPSASPLALASLNGLACGAVHLPEWDVALLTLAGGVVWSHTYQRDRCLLPLALSHAVLGAAFYAWVKGKDVLVPFG